MISRLDGLSMADRLLAYRDWLATGECRIVCGDGKVRSLGLKPGQVELWGAMLKQARQGKPIRVIQLKPRKIGISTYCQSLAFFMGAQTDNWSSRTMAHTDEATTEDIHIIAQRLARAELELVRRPAGMGNPIQWAHGSRMTTRTGGGWFVGTGGTENFMQITELAKWKGERRMIQSTLTSALQSVLFHPHTIIVIESTANMMHPAGEEFRDRWFAAKQKGSPYAAVFSPWFDDPDASLQRHSLVEEELGPEEVELRARHELSLEQLAWRRMKIAELGDVIWFRQDFPSTDEEAFQAPQGRVFPMLGARHCVSADVRELVSRGYVVYRGIDFGGVDPFVCLWAAHRPEAGANASFSIDEKACPNAWRELTGYRWEEHRNKPQDRDDHCCDALRYMVMHFNLSGHLHVFRELYEPNSASMGRTVLNQADDVLRFSREDVKGTVFDRSQPQTIVMLNQRGIRGAGCRTPEKLSERGEKVDGVMRLQVMMSGAHPLSRAPRPRSEDDVQAFWKRIAPDARLGLPTRDFVRRHKKRLDPLFGAY